MPIRLRDAQTWRSTGNPGTPSAWPSTTFAVLRPTPGSSTSASIVFGHVAAMMFDERARHSHERSRLRAEEARRVNQRLQLVGRRLGERGGVRIAREQRRRDAIDAGVGGLRRQNRRDEQLIGVLVVELGVGAGMLALQLPEDGQGASRAVTLGQRCLFSGPGHDRRFRPTPCRCASVPAAQR